MHGIVAFLSERVRRAPVAMVVLALVLTATLGSLVPRAEQATGNEGFSPDNRELQALERAGELFAGSAESVMQVVVQGPDVISADGLAAVGAVQEAILSSEAADHLAARRERAPVVSHLLPVQAALAGRPAGQPGAGAAPDPSGAAPAGGQPSAVPGAGPGAPGESPVAGSPRPLDDAAVDELFAEGLADLPPEQAGLVEALLPEGTHPEAAAAPRGLMLVFLDTSGIEGATDTEEFERLTEVQAQVAGAAEGAALPAGFTVRAFSFQMLFDTQEEFNQEIGRLFGAAFLIILVILSFVFLVRPRGGTGKLRAARRTVADVALTLATILMAITWMQGLGVLLGPDFLAWIGKFSPPTQVVPILLIGLGVDYSIHLNSRYREEVGTGRTPEAAAVTASRTVGVALVLATVTTAVGFLTNITNPLPALRDFGVLAAVGIVAAFTLMLTFVPAVRLLLDRRAGAAGRLPLESLGATSERALPRLMARSSVLAERFAGATLAVTLVLAGLGAWGLTRLDTTFSVSDFVPQDSPVLATFEILQDDFAGGFGETTSVLLEGPVATPEAHNALVDALGNLADTEGVVRFGGTAAAASPVSVIAALATPPGQGPGEAALYDPAFAETARASGLREDLTVAPGADVAAIYTAALEAAPERAGRVLHRGAGPATGGAPVDVGASPAAGFTALVELQTSAGESGAAALRRDLSGDFAPVSDAGVEAVPTSENIVTAVIVKALQDSQIISLALTLLVAMLLLVAVFWAQVRRPMLGVITIAPVALIVLWTFGLMAATGIPFNPITAILSALAIGIGVPFTIHITHRFREDRLRYDDPHRAIASTVRHTGGALAGSALTTIAGFGILMTSSLVPFRQMGQVTAYAIGFALVSAVLVLPSMLILWDRWHSRRGRLAVPPAAAVTAGGPGPQPVPAAPEPAPAAPVAEPGSVPPAPVAGSVPVPGGGPRPESDGRGPVGLSDWGALAAGRSDRAGPGRPARPPSHRP